MFRSMGGFGLATKISVVTFKWLYYDDNYLAKSCISIIIKYKTLGALSLCLQFKSVKPWRVTISAAVSTEMNL